ncbi:MAG TPA: hypothetical protein PLA65_13115 [Spirochaetota bacterium]|nr:hypothetical protein [Spirochaetota bacterium]HOD15133.1 hypothetical protein [Spirochaetota bacterium]HPG51913.1 hypothetical protein [Spirochaetota bacterium]HPN12996.1 hypothetical protein [Spirochaetota bacterium]
MKKLLLALVAVVAISGYLFAQNPGVKEKDAAKGKAEAAEEDSSIGLDFSINYYTKYIWRGIDFYDGDGYFYPALAWEIFGSGLTLTVAGEVSQSWVFNGFQPKPKKYYFEDWTLSTLYKKQKQINNYAYANQGLDVGLDYSYTFEDIITLGAGFWYYWYYNSKTANEMAWPVVESLNIRKKWDTSYFSANVNIGLDCVPWINPTLAVFYDNYYGYERSGDYYVQLGFSHEFVLVPDVVTITPAVTAGYYYGRTFGYNNWYLADPNGTVGDLSDDIIWRNHVALKKGVSDVVPSVTLSVTKDGWYFTSGFFWVIVPAKSWYKGGPVHRYYAQVGMGYAI